MNTSPPLNPPPGAGPAGPAFVPTLDGSGTDSRVDPQAVQRAKQEIQGLIREIAQLAKSDIAPAAFYEAMLTRVVSALAAEGGAIWLVGDAGTLAPICQINLQLTGLSKDKARAAQHAALLRNTLAGASELLIPPRSSSSGPQSAGNPTPYLLVLSPLPGDQGPQGVIEVFQRSDTRPATQRGYLRFVQQMCELAGDYVRSRRLRLLADQQTLWHQLDGLARTIHQNLNVSRTAFAIANEGRRLVGCDRISVAICEGKRCRIAAISGQDTFDPRSGLVIRLMQLTRAVTKTGEAMWFHGDSSKLAPQVEKAVQAYVDLSHSKTVAVIPLERPQPDQQKKSAPEIVGALVIEQIEDSAPGEGFSERVRVLAEHSGPALANALEHETLFLMPLWRALGRMRWLVAARTLPKTVAVMGLVAGLLAALVLVPADFQLEARGTLQPSVRRDIFAGVDGVVIKVPVRHGQQVARGETLAELRNTDLEVQITDLVGRQSATLEQVRSLERAMLGNRAPKEEQDRMSGELARLRKQQASLGLQLKLLKHKQQALIVKSELPGQVVTWQVHDRLIRRPVRQGQVLLSVADPAGPWELELHVPEDRMGHIAEAARASSEPLEVTYFLATNPGVQHQGRVEEIHAAAEVRGDEGNTVLVRVAIDKNAVGDLRPGATVTAKIDCGRRSLGYVWFHDLIGFLQSRVLFRL